MSARSQAEAMLVQCQERLRRRIQWMMGERARRAADTDDYLGEVMVRILEETAKLQWRDENHFLALAMCPVEVGRARAVTRLGQLLRK